jgi:hypothetical protein
VPAQLITVAETPLFQRQARDVWNENGREDFVNFIARNPGAGDIIADTGGVRKVRWGVAAAANAAARASSTCITTRTSRFTC